MRERDLSKLPKTFGFRAAWLAVEAAGLSRHAKLVLIVLARHSDDDGHAHPGEKRIAANTGATVRSVRRVLDCLAARGIITIKRRGGPRTRSGQRLNAYTIKMAVLEALPVAYAHGDRPERDRTSASPLDGTPVSALEGTSQTGKRGRRNPPNGLGRNGSAGTDPPTPRKGARTEELVSPGVDMQALAWLDGFNRATGLDFAPTRENLRAIRERIAEGRYAADDAEAVASWAASTWPGTRRGDFIRPQTVFGTKFDGYLQAARNGHARSSFVRNVNAAWAKDER